MPDEKTDKTTSEEKSKPAPMVEEEPIVTEHEAVIGGKKLAYTVTTGKIPMRDENDEIEAQMFFMAYTAKKEKGVERPVMFTFNGGPGSPSLWLHLGALGPKRVKIEPDAEIPPAPFALVDNPHSWLGETDLVFIDPVGTGFSRAKTKEIGEKYWGLQGDIESVGEFIRLYLTRYERWMSPLYLVGESYGTTRAAGVAGHLIERGIAFNGIVLVSSVLNFQMSHHGQGNDIPYALILPTYTATAFYHGKLDKDLSRDLRSTLRKVEEWAVGEYLEALTKGDRISEASKRRIAARLSRFTGLGREFIERRNLRIDLGSFAKELLRDQRRTVGRLDSRFKGIDKNVAGDSYEHDPSMTAIMPAYTATFNHYVRTVLGYKTDQRYEIFGGIKSPWSWGNSIEPPDTSEALRKAMAMNPHMKIYIASGYYDFATPYFATYYTLDHMGIEPALRSNITTGEYEAGHMMYIHEPSLEQLKREVAGFISSSRG